MNIRRKGRVKEQFCLITQMNFLLLARTGSAVRQPVEQKNAGLIPISFENGPLKNFIVLCISQFVCY